MKYPVVTHGALALGLALGGCAGTSVKPAARAAAEATAPSDLESALRMAQAQRKSGDLDGATKTLSQLTIFAPDDSRVLGEYGKTLLDKGQIADAVAFLERAIALQPADWSLFSAIGVAYAQSANDQAALQAFSHALALKPGDATILNNAALLQLQTGDLAGAESLLTQAAQAGGANPRIGQNLALVRELKGASPAPQAAASAPSPAFAPGLAAPIAAPSPLVTKTVVPVEVAVPARARIALSSLEVPDAAPAVPPTFVKSTLVGTPAVAPKAPSTPYYVQVGTFAVQENAVRITAKLQQFDAHMSPMTINGRAFYVVRLGPFEAGRDAQTTMAQVRDAGVTDARLVAKAATPRTVAPTPQLRLSENGPPVPPQASARAR